MMSERSKLCDRGRNALALDWRGSLYVFGKTYIRKIIEEDSLPKQRVTIQAHTHPCRFYYHPVSILRRPSSSFPNFEVFMILSDYLIRDFQKAIGGNAVNKSVNPSTNRDVLLCVVWALWSLFLSLSLCVCVVCWTFSVISKITFEFLWLSPPTDRRWPSWKKKWNQKANNPQDECECQKETETERMLKRENTSPYIISRKKNFDNLLIWSQTLKHIHCCSEMREGRRRERKRRLEEEARVETKE